MTAKLDSFPKIAPGKGNYAEAVSGPVSVFKGSRVYSSVSASRHFCVLERSG